MDVDAAVLYLFYQAALEPQLWCAAMEALAVRLSLDLAQFIVPGLQAVRGVIGTVRVTDPWDQETTNPGNCCQ